MFEIGSFWNVKKKKKNSTLKAFSILYSMKYIKSYISRLTFFQITSLELHFCSEWENLIVSYILNGKFYFFITEINTLKIIKIIFIEKFKKINKLENFFATTKIYSLIFYK